MRLNPKNYTFGVTSGKLLRFLINQMGIEVDPSKIKEILEITLPKNKKEVRGFLGRIQFINYFISKLTTTCGPLFRLLKKGEKFQWRDQCQTTFDKIKAYLQNPLVL